MTLNPEARAHLTRLRAELQSTRSRLCPCGVEPARCVEHKTTSDQNDAEEAQ